MFQKIFFDASALLSHEYKSHSVHMKPSTTAYPPSKMGDFVTLAFAEKKVIKFYYDTLIFKRTPDMLNTQRVYCEGVMKVACERFEPSVMLLTKRVSCSGRKSHSFWLVTVKYACLQLAKNPCCLSNAALLVMGGGIQEPSENSKVDKFATARSDYTTFYAVSVPSTRSVLPEVELLFDC